MNSLYGRAMAPEPSVFEPMVPQVRALRLRVNLGPFEEEA